MEWKTSCVISTVIFSLVLILICIANSYPKIPVLHKVTTTSKTPVGTAKQTRDEKLTRNDVIKKHYLPPSDMKLNLANPNQYDSSQYGQGGMMNKLFFKNKTNGFFFEVGAFDGEHMSNTLMYERHFGWTGILVEALPTRYKDMVAKHRKAHMFNLCLGKPGEYATIEGLKIPCVSISDIINFLDVKTIDYFVMDVENDNEWMEPEMLIDLDFNKIKFGLFQIEVGWHRIDNFMPNGKLRIIDRSDPTLKEMERYFFAKRFMKLKNFEIKAITSIDLIFGLKGGSYKKQPVLVV